MTAQRNKWIQINTNQFFFSPFPKLNTGYITNNF